MHENLLCLKPYFQTLSSRGCGEYSSEIQKYVTDSRWPLPEEKRRLDVWWNKVFKTYRYPMLSSLVCPCPSIFAGAMAECSFRLMNDVIDSKSGCLEIETYGTIMATKYNLKYSMSVALKYD